MPKFMSSHSMPAGAMKREQIDQLAQMAQNDPVVRPYRSFLNLAEGKVFCVMEAPNKSAGIVVHEDEDALRLYHAGGARGRSGHGQKRLTRRSGCFAGHVESLDASQKKSIAALLPRF